jgi:predicted nuclease with TOPRIM domain
VSQPEDNGAAPDEAAFERLESAVARLMAAYAEESSKVSAERTRADAAEARTGELAELVKRFTGDEAEAGLMMTRLKDLEQENADLRSRLERGRDGVDRMIARIRFLENQG